MYSANCEQCFGLCCVALPYAKSADFAFNKDGGTPCQNLNADYRCDIHKNLRNNGLRGCTVYDCFGAGQKVSQVTYKGKSWRDDPAIAEEMFNIFPIMQQLHEMLYYLNEALNLKETHPIYTDLQKAMAKTEQLTDQDPKSLINLHVPTHRALVNDLLLRTSELVREKVKKNVEHNKYSKKIRSRDLIGANLRGANLRGTNLRGILLIAADLREADLRMTDLIGTDFRDADLSGANLEGSIFLTQAQLNSAKGNCKTKLPPSLSIPGHWLH
ncbi:pentapeptide repeat-containing protein [Paenibacillus sp. EKM212P]|uniref:pentapeptide repeat-containing protein n=1 Tax=Paenibacillus sp. EKM212P TaxID=1683680 RepID=UPI0013ECDF10|nr:pentapeptide repeat-containing protein [Paenibacillus sp. EKM212P]KAF6574046.1 pentapeptide repeat-containing protein [Paenibacillus sp. EKM212P]